MTKDNHPTQLVEDTHLVVVEAFHPVEPIEGILPTKKRKGHSPF